MMQRFLANYAYININDPMSRVPGIGQVAIFGAGQVRDALLGASRHARQHGDHCQRHHHGAHESKQSEPSRPNRRRACTARPAVHLYSSGAGPSLDAEEFGEVVVRANPDGSVVRMKDVARVELGRAEVTARSDG